MLTDLWMAMVTHNDDAEHVDPGTGDPIALIVDQLQVTFADTMQDDQGPGRPNLYWVADNGPFRLSPGHGHVRDFNVSALGLTDVSVRAACLGTDAWRPRLIAVWGHDSTAGGPIPIAMETALEGALSTDPAEGNVSVPLRRVARGGDESRINYLLLAMTTSTVEDSGTSDIVRLQVTSNGHAVYNDALPRRFSNDLGRGQAYVYRLRVERTFTRAGVEDDGHIQLQIDGEEAWLPASFFLFGLDAGTGRPNTMVPLVWLPRWNLGKLSTDPREGKSLIELPKFNLADLPRPRAD